MSTTVQSVERLKKEIDRLTQEQAEVLRTATYIGMTPDESREYDKRRNHILTLIKELEGLEKAA